MQHFQYVISIWDRLQQGAESFKQMPFILTQCYWIKQYQLMCSQCDSCLKMPSWMSGSENRRRNYMAVIYATKDRKDGPCLNSRCEVKYNANEMQGSVVPISVLVLTVTVILLHIQIIRHVNHWIGGIWVGDFNVLSKLGIMLPLFRILSNSKLVDINYY